MVLDRVPTAGEHPHVFQRVFIEAMAVEQGPQRISSAALEAEMAEPYRRLGVPQGCIEGLVGVRARRFFGDEPIDEIAGRVVEQVLAQRPDLRGRIGALVSSSVCKDYVEPSVAALVAGRAALSTECQTFDVSNACLGFITGIELVARRIELGDIDAAVVVAAENSRSVVRATQARLADPTTTMQDYREALPTLTLGSGAVAMLLVHQRLATTTHRVHGVVTRTDSSSSRICIGTPTWMKTDAPMLLQRGVELAEQTWRVAQQRFGWSPTTIDAFICHQVGAGHLTTLFERLGLPLDKATLTFPELGNVGPAAVPITLDVAVRGWEYGPATVGAGARLALMGIGSGLNVAMMDVTW
jgi:acyl-CoA:acyl-CoA alkyltransferase